MEGGDPAFPGLPTVQFLCGRLGCLGAVAQWSEHSCASHYALCLLCTWEDCRWVVLSPPCHVMCNLLQHVMYVSLTMVMVVRVGSAVSLASLTGEARVTWK